MNNNPVAEWAIQEIEEDFLRQEPGGGAVSPLDLSIAIACLMRLSDSQVCHHASYRLKGEGEQPYKHSCFRYYPFVY